MEAADLIILQLVFVHLEAMSCMDLLLRWVVIRICDTNTQALLRVLDLTKALFNLMISKASPWSDQRVQHKRLLHDISKTSESSFMQGYDTCPQYQRTINYRIVRGCLLWAF